MRLTCDITSLAYMRVVVNNYSRLRVILMCVGPRICQRDARFACVYVRTRGVNWDRGQACLPVVTDERMMKFLSLMHKKAPGGFVYVII